MFIFILLITATSFGQMVWDITFEDGNASERVQIDTVSNPDNTWQIGSPDKAVFNIAYSSPNVIVTDTANPYPVNDTSSFTVIHIAGYGWSSGYPKVDIGGYYFVHSDSLTDYGYIDFSADMGNTWYRADSMLGYCSWGAQEELPIFTGNSNGWQHFYYCLEVPATVNAGDTILYRFNFISDFNQTNKDGLMFDNLHFEDWAESVQEVQDENSISIFPNPVSERLNIRKTKSVDVEDIQVMNLSGQILITNIPINSESIDVSSLPKGIYYLKYSSNKKFFIKKFAVVPR